MVKERRVISYSSSPAGSQVPRYHSTDGTICMCGGGGSVCVCHQTSLSWQMMMKNAQDGTIEGTAKHAVGQIHTRSLLHTNLDTQRHITHPHIRTNAHGVNRVPSAGSLSVVCQRQARVVYSSHVNNGPIWTGLIHTEIYPSSQKHRKTAHILIFAHEICFILDVTWR